MPRKKTTTKPFRTKKGKYGTLYLYSMTYQDKADRYNTGVYRTWAYGTEHAEENFLAGPDSDGWKITSRPKRVRGYANPTKKTIKRKNPGVSTSLAIVTVGRALKKAGYPGVKALKPVTRGGKVKGRLEFHVWRADAKKIPRRSKVLAFAEHCAKTGKTVVNVGPTAVAFVTKKGMDAKAKSVVSQLKKHGYMPKKTDVAKKNPAKKKPARKKATRAQINKLAAEFKKVRAAAAKTIPSVLKTKLVLDASVHDSPRHFAMTKKLKGGGWTIHVAPELALEPQHVRVGVLRHEFGHVAAWTVSGQKLGGPLRSRTYDARERRADRIAENLFKTKIYYDKRGVETTRKGKRPRPKGLK